MIKKAQDLFDNSEGDHDTTLWCYISTIYPETNEGDWTMYCENGIYYIKRRISEEDE